MARHHDMLGERERKARALEREGRHEPAWCEWRQIERIAEAHNDREYVKTSRLRQKMCLQTMAKEYLSGQHKMVEERPPSGGALSVEDVFG